MTDMNPETLAVLQELRALRADYPEYVRRVDADLAVEKAKRLAAKRGEIEARVLRAFAMGIPINQIKQWYGTKDFRTIKNIITEREAERIRIETEVAQAAVEAQQASKWFEVREGGIEIEGDVYDVIVLDEGDGLLLIGTGDFDGVVLDPSSVGREAELFRALSDG